MSKIIDHELERFLLSGVIQHKNQYDEISPIIKEEDFDLSIHKAIYKFLTISAMSGEEYDHKIVAFKIEQAKLRYEMELSVGEYLETISLMNIKEESVIEYAKRLKSLSVRRQIEATALNVATKMRDCGDEKYSAIINLADSTFYSGVQVFESGNNDPIDIFAELEAQIEDIGNKQEPDGVICPYPILRGQYGNFLPGHIYVFAARLKVGKALWEDEVVPTPKGFVKIKDINVGDFVYAPDGSQTKVLAKASWSNRELYKISDGSSDSILADAEHEWVAKKRHDYDPDTYTSKQMAEHRCKNSGYIIPVAQPLTNDEKELSIPPYILGCWLGDGTSADATITNNDQYVIDKWTEYGESLGLKVLPKGDCGYRITSGTKSGRQTRNIVLEKLRELNLLNNKHIPDIYMNASIEQRKELLRGIMDTDGCIDLHQYGRAEISQCRKELSYQILTLIRSLGYKTKMGVYDARLYGRIVNKNYRMSFYTQDVSIFNVPKKRERIRTEEKSCQSNRSQNHYVTSEYYGMGNTVCIQVEHPSHMFLCGRNMIPTHNSTIVQNIGYKCCCENPLQDVKCLYLDTELTTAQFQTRLVSSLSGVSEAYIRTGRWRKEASMLDAVREALARTRKFHNRIQHIYVGGADMETLIPIIRRWHRKNVANHQSATGRPFFGMVVLDYLKLSDELDKKTALRTDQVLGRKVDRFKQICTDLNVCPVTAIQTSRANVGANKVSDSSVISNSDMVAQLASNVCLLEKLDLEEVQMLDVDFGVRATHSLISLASRNQGYDAPGFTDTVKIQKGDGFEYVSNKLYYNFDNFLVTEVNSLDKLVNTTDHNIATNNSCVRDVDI